MWTCVNHYSHVKMFDNLDINHIGDLDFTGASTWTKEEQYAGCQDDETSCGGPKVLSVLGACPLLVQHLSRTPPLRRLIPC